MTGLECWQKGEGIDHAAAYAEKDGRSVIRGVYKCGIDCATGMTSIPQMVIDAGYGLEDESEKLLNAVQNYKGSKAEIPGILLRHAEQTGENLYRMGKTFAGSEIDKWNGMSIEERCEAGGYIMGTLALLFVGGEESLSGKAAGEAGEVAGDASRTAETLTETEKTTEALEKTIAPGVKAPYVPDEEELAMQRIFDEQRQPCEEYEDFIKEISKEEPLKKQYDYTDFYNEFMERSQKSGLSREEVIKSFIAMENGDYKLMASYFDTSSPYNGAVFWSGDKASAAAYAKNIGGTIMEQTPGGKAFDGWDGLQKMYPEWDSGATPQKPIWTALSSQYADSVNGTVTYVHPDGYFGNIWEETESKIVMHRLKDGYVTDLIEVKK